MDMSFYYWLSASCVMLALFFIVLIWIMNRSLALYQTVPLYQTSVSTIESSSSTASLQKERILNNSQHWWGNVKQHYSSKLGDMVITMRQAGYITARQQTVCLFKILLAWVCLIMIFLGQQMLADITVQQRVLYTLLFVVFGIWVSLRWLTLQARKRARKIDEEVLTAVHMMAILWQVGLSVESLLRTYYQESADITPEMNKEIELILARIETGQNRETVLNDIASHTLSVGFQDMLTMIAQVSGSGGGLKASFQSLAKILQERKRIDLQEVVTKMSGKISIIMMAFMFPALFIVLAGPAALALMSAFGGK